MKTIDRRIAESVEFVCEEWGQGEASVAFYAPVTRCGGMTWVHPTWAREATWEQITRRAERIWLVSGSLWNPAGYRLLWAEGREQGPALARASIRFRKESSKSWATASNAGWMGSGCSR